MSEKIARELIESVGGKVTEVSGPLPDGSGFMIGSFPLPKDHWIYDGDRHESYGVFNTPPMVFKMGAKEAAMLIIAERDDSQDAGLPVAKGVTMTKQSFADAIREAGKYAVRCATLNGKDMDFDPDALLQNLVTGFLGYHTENGLSDDEWANPPQFNQHPKA